MLVVGIAVACLLPPPAAVVARSRAASDGSRSTIIALRGAADDRAVSVDNALVRALRRFVGGGEKDKEKEIVCGQSRYGCDPRLADQALSSGASDNAATSSEAADFGNQGNPFPQAESGVVGELYGGVAQLNALLEAAGEGTVVLKFKREGCPACNSTIAPLASAAAAYADRAAFLTVDYDQNRAFCKRSGLKVVPCAHIYMGGRLVDAMPLGPRKWAEFSSRLEHLVGAPSSEILAAQLPPDKNADARSVAGLSSYL
jgi:thiol-disulfide isomerase/thioredoxin